MGIPRCRPRFEYCVLLDQYWDLAYRRCFGYFTSSTLTLDHPQGKHADAVPLLEKAMAIRKQALDPGHPDLAQTQEDIDYVQNIVNQPRGNVVDNMPQTARDDGALEKGWRETQSVTGKTKKGFDLKF